MNRNQLLALLVLVALLGGGGLMLYKRNQQDWRTPAVGVGQKWLANLPVNDVAEISIKQTGGELTLHKKDDTWAVKDRQDYAANFNNIREFLAKLAEQKVAQLEPVGPSQFGRMELLAPGKGEGSGTAVELRDKSGKAIRSLMLGKKYSKKSESASPSPFGGGDFPIGRFVMDQASSGSVALVNETFNNIETKPAEWLDKEFFRVEKVKEIALTATVATNSWKLTRETEAATEWKLADAKADEKLDSAKASGVSSPLASPSFDDVFTADAKPEQTGLNTPTVVVATTFDGFEYTLKIGGKTNVENYGLTVAINATLAKERTPGKDEKAEDKAKLDKEFADKRKALEEKLAQEKRFEKWTYQVSKFTFDSLLKNRADLLAEKKEEPKEEAKSGDAKKEQ